MIVRRKSLGAEVRISESELQAMTERVAERERIEDQPPQTLLQEDIIPLIKDATGSVKFMKSAIGHLASRMNTFDVIMAEEIMVGESRKDGRNGEK